MNQYLNKKSLADLDLANKRVVVRFDFNVPIKDGKITDDKRITAALKTIKYLLDQNCSIVALSHLSRIKSIEDIKSNKKTLAPVAKRLGELLPGIEVKFEPSTDFNKITSSVNNLKPKQILLLENTRYYDVNENNEVIKRESKNNPELAKFYASLGVAFVNDAFGTAHRAHASNAGIASLVKDSCLGFLVENEIKNISKAIDNPSHPYVAILGGAKVSDKIKVITNLLTKCDKIIIGGGMAFTFAGAEGKQIGKSINEPDMYPLAKQMLSSSRDKLVLTVDSKCSPEYADLKPEIYNLDDGIPHHLEGLDIGPKTVEAFVKVIKQAKTIVWNGPCGVTEFKNYYAEGTRAVAQAVKEATQNGCYSLIGGGDSASAIIQLGFKESDFSFISTGGGAALTLIEGSPLKGLDPIPNK